MRSWLTPIAKHLIRQWLCVLVACVSFMLTRYSWNRPSPPTWTRDSDEWKQVIGILDHRLFSVDRPENQNETSISTLRIRDLRTGEILNEFPTPFREYRDGKITPDGQWAVLTGPAVPIAVLSTETGQLRYQPIYSPVHGSVSLITADSRYCWIGDKYLVNLSTGRLDLETSDVTAVSEDSLEYLTYEYRSDGCIVKVRRISDNRACLIGKLPEVPGLESDLHPDFMTWTGNRLYFLYRVDVESHPLGKCVCWSFDASGETLTAPRPEPQFFAAQVSSHLRRYVLPWHANLEHDFAFGWEKGSFPYWLNDKLDSVGISLGRFGSDYSEYTWRSLSPETRKPVGLVIGPMSHRVKFSPSQDWLVEYGSELRVWKLPAHRTWRRYWETLLAGVSPWILWWCFRAMKRQFARKRLTTPPLNTQCGGTATEGLNHGSHEEADQR